MCKENPREYQVQIAGLQQKDGGLQSDDSKKENLIIFYRYYQLGSDIVKRFTELAEGREEIEKTMQMKKY